VTDGSGWSELSYDARGNLTLERRNLGGLTYDTAYAYDAADRLAETVTPSGRIVTYQRDALGRVSGVTTRENELALPVTLASNAGYLAFGPMSGLDYGNGLSLTLGYDLDYRLTGLVSGSALTPVQDLAYGYDLASNITSIADGLDLTRDQTFDYDSLHRLSLATGAYGQIGYDYDAVGNRTQRTVTTGTGALVETYTSDFASNRLASLDLSDGTARALAYGGAGHLSRDQRPDGSVLDLATDRSGRLAAVSENAAPTANYRHNARGERVARIAGGRRVQSLYDSAGRLMAEYDAGPAGAAAGPSSLEVVLDNDDPGAGGTAGWASATELSGYHGADYAAAEGGGAAELFTWTPAVPAAGSYELLAKWPDNLNRGSEASYTVHHALGSPAARACARLARLPGRGA
jgi:YD repeat-containing protein